MRSAALGTGAALWSGIAPARAAADVPKRDFIDTVLTRRSGRFAKGMRTETGPLSFASTEAPEPLTYEEEAALAFFACGITGYAKADLVYDHANDGQMMAGFVGRTIPSPDAVHSATLFVTNDRETYLMKRPADFSPTELRELVALAKERRFSEIHARSKITIKSERSAPSLDPIRNLPVNKWDLYKPGTTYLLPVMDLTYLYLNVLFTFLSRGMGAFIVDSRNFFQPAGLKDFGKELARMREYTEQQPFGKPVSDPREAPHLEDALEGGRTMSIENIESGIQRTASVEIGAMIQNLSLGAHSLGLGGFPNFAGHDYAWFEAIGFDMLKMKGSKYLGAGRFTQAIAYFKGDVDVPYPVGLTVGGDKILKPFCPPNYASMDDAVDAFLERKFGARGEYGDRIAASAFRNPAAIGAYVRRDLYPEKRTISAVKAYCRYVYDTYGRFPATTTAYGTVVGFQAAHLDPDFYRRHYQPER